MEIIYQPLSEEMVSPGLFSRFKRYQEVHLCYRKEGAHWVLKEIPFIEDWDHRDFEELSGALKRTLRDSGVVYGAFDGNSLIGFFSIRVGLFGAKNEYIQLSELHVSYEYRRKGIGKELFHLAEREAFKHGARKLYISAHSSFETQSFYRSLGCVEAFEYNSKLVAMEPYDCQLEYALSM